MDTRRILLVAIAAGLVIGAFTPSAAGDHCRSKLTAYGRISSAPVASPPYSSTTAGVCVSLYRQGVDDHVLPPEADQVMVRVNGDFGGYSTILIRLDGLGFDGHTYPAIRQVSSFGGVFYQLAQWVAFPEGPQSGELRITAYYPAGPVTEVYRTFAAPEAPAPPAPPTVPPV